MGYTEEQRDAAVELLRNPKLSLRAINKQTGIPTGTLSRWAKDAMVHRPVQKTGLEGMEARAKRLKARRDRVGEQVLRKAEDILKRMDMPHVQVLTKDGDALGLPMAAAKDVRDYAVAFGILLDKFRLEMGEATSVTEERHASPRERLKARVDELEAKRSKRTA